MKFYLMIIAMITLIGLYTLAGNDQLQDQPTRKERKTRLAKEAQEAAAYELFKLPPTRQKEK